MNGWAPIQYRGFYDVPRNFLVNHRGVQVLFSCPFDELLDDYPASYKVYLLPDLTDQELAGDWEALPLKATRYVGEVSTGEVRFDPTRRREVETTALDNLLGSLLPSRT